MIKTATEQTFERDVLSAAQPALVDFWAEWCGPCRVMLPVLEELSEDLEGRVDVVKVDVDANPGLAAAYGVRSIPTLALFASGELVDVTTGARSKAQLEQWLAASLPREGLTA